MKKILIVSFALALALGTVPVSVLASSPCCTDYAIEIVSDTSNTVVGDGNAVAIIPHPAWTAVIPGSTTWIWKSSATAPNEVVAFEKSFTVVGTVLAAQLDIATDNSYAVFIDGAPVAADIADNNFQVATQDVHNLTANVTSGTHTLRVEVKNVGAYNPSSNPAGLLYKLVVTSQECPTPCCSGDIKVRNRNNATVINNVSVVANSGGNVAAGGSGGNGGTSGSTIAVGGSCQEHSLTAVSDTSNVILPGGGNAVPVTFIHPAWTANIPGATWIWSVDPVANPTTDEFSTFEKSFSIVGSVTSAVLDIASDNSYKVWINGTLVGEDASENNFSSTGQDQYTTTVVSALQSGANTIKVEVKNWALGGGTPTTNPAGLLYKLVVNSKECPAGSVAIGGSANGGSGGSNSGNITTGAATAKSKVINKVNTNITRVRR